MSELTQKNQRNSLLISFWQSIGRPQARLWKSKLTKSNLRWIKDADGAADNLAKALVVPMRLDQNPALFERVNQDRICLLKRGSMKTSVA